ncbi:MAG: S46 family peptidase, partial [Bacteroidota bacterium]|nr:S46 family peptidase [Bacteroidota bacterium]
MIRRILYSSLIAVTLLVAASLTADEGMYPLSEISRLDLQSKGLEIPVSEIYNPDGVSLVDAICQVGGGTGEFVSPDGLILTNHHIAFAGVTAASTPEHDYLREGFTAFTREEELPAEGYVCRITEDYRDVSDEVLAVVKDFMTPAERSDAIREKMRTLATEEENGRENISCEVSEMFPGKTYVLFTYRIIRDVRLVYVPPLSVGNYGGEVDNWIWPRHTGDFSFLRAYVAPDGSTAAYAEENVPFIPKRHIKVAPEGVSKDDFVFILGYPGRTYRHKTADYIALYEKTILPYLSARYD